MITYHLLGLLFPHSEWLPGLVYVIIVGLLYRKTTRDCKEIGENIRLHGLLILFFPLLFGFCWLLIWPGSLRLRLCGTSIQNTSEARLYRRRENGRAEKHNSSPV
ncbi:hypothetical protein [Luteolibacter sp. AS25]|uniref:hypothetical protein n=1 Tax=Luteolibacter sp. AS25 TaxID=3135776 RepID=UPI00398B59C9